MSTSSAPFSKIAYDHKHEQNNKCIKATSGYINLVNKEDSSFLRKLELCCSEIFQFIEKVESSQEETHHKEDSKAFNLKYVSDVKKVITKISNNPFSTSQFQKLTSSLIFPQVIHESCDKLFDIGEKRYQEFVDNRFIFGKEGVMSTISRNSLKLPRHLKSVLSSSPQIK